jgi:hypothetical protein
LLLFYSLKKKPNRFIVQGALAYGDTLRLRLRASARLLPERAQPHTELVIA